MSSSGGVVAVVLLGVVVGALLSAELASAGFIRRQGTGFVDPDTGKAFRFGGTNNYYLHHEVSSPSHNSY